MYCPFLDKDKEMEADGRALRILVIAAPVLLGICQRMLPHLAGDEGLCNKFLKMLQRFFCSLELRFKSLEHCNVLENIATFSCSKLALTNSSKRYNGFGKRYNVLGQFQLPCALISAFKFPI